MERVNLIMAFLEMYIDDALKFSGKDVYLLVL